MVFSLQAPCFAINIQAFIIKKCFKQHKSTLNNGALAFLKNELKGGTNRLESGYEKPAQKTAKNVLCRFPAR